MDEDHNSAPDEPVSNVVAEAGQDPSPTADQILAASVVFEGGLGMLAILLGWAFAEPVLALARPTTVAVLWGVLATVPMVAMLLFIERWPVGPFRELKRLVDEMLVPLFAQCRLWHLAIIAALAGFGEELLFRGLIQTSFVGWLGVWPAAIVVGILFGFAHPISKTYVVTAAVIGIYLGALLIITNNLLVPIIAHGLYDFVALVYLTRKRVAG